MANSHHHQPDMDSATDYTVNINKHSYNTT